jgi:hypothetical protein
MVSVALDGTRLDTADGLTRPGAWLVSRGYDLALLVLSFLPRDRVITPSFARP